MTTTTTGQRPPPDDRGTVRGRAPSRSPRRRRCCPRRSTGRTSCANRPMWCCRPSSPAARAWCGPGSPPPGPTRSWPSRSCCCPTVLGRRERPGAAGGHLRGRHLGGPVADRVPALGVRRPAAGRLLRHRRRHHPGRGGRGLDRAAPVRRRAARRTPRPTARHRLVGHAQRDHPAQPGAAPLARRRRPRRQRDLPAQPGRHPRHRRPRLPGLGPGRPARQHRLGTVGRRPRRHAPAAPVRPADPALADAAARQRDSSPYPAQRPAAAGVRS